MARSHSVSENGDDTRRTAEHNEDGEESEDSDADVLVSPSVAALQAQRDELEAVLLDRNAQVGRGKSSVARRTPTKIREG